jgi:acetyl esterase/lipase
LSSGTAVVQGRSRVIGKRPLALILILLIGCLAGLAISKRLASKGENWHVYRDLQYGTALNQTIDLFVPGKERGPHPLIIFIHGGGWAAGDKSGATFFELSKRHYALASINYRLLWQDPFPAQIQDCKAAVSYLRSNAKLFGLDPNRIGVWGCSAGGHLAMLLATTGDGEVPDWESECNGVSSRIQAVCDWSGPVDLVRLMHSKGLERRMRIYTKNLIGPETRGRDFRWAEASPVKYIKRGDPPVLIMHARKDPLVPISQSEELINCLKANRVDSEFIPVDSPYHSFYTFEKEAVVGDFFDRVLKRSDIWSHLMSRADRANLFAHSGNQNDKGNE